MGRESSGARSVLRVIDFVTTGGGTSRCTGALLSALLEERPQTRMEVVTSPACRPRLEKAISESAGSKIGWLLEPCPMGSERNQLPKFPGHGRLRQAWSWMLQGRPYRQVPLWTAAVQQRWFEGADRVFFPSIQRYQVCRPLPLPTVGVLHDALILTRDDVADPELTAEERANTDSWWRSRATLVTDVSSTAAKLAGLFGGPRPKPLEVVPLAVQDFRQNGTPASWPSGLEGDYLLYPAHLSDYKNHEVLLGALARWEARRPLVLNGRDVPDLSQVRPHQKGRGKELLSCCRALGLRLGEDVLSLGFVSDATLSLLYRRAWAIVFPSREEGWGFPVSEALAQGVPVVCANIPSLREQLEVLGGRALWFDPGDIDSLLAQLRELDGNYGQYRSRAQEDAPRVRRRSWRQVACDYWRLLDEAS